MSDYQQYLQERDKIDFYIQKGFTIQSVSETLNGSFVEMVNEEKKVSLLIQTAEGRKYFSVFLLNKQKGA